MNGWIGSVLMQIAEELSLIMAKSLSLNVNSRPKLIGVKKTSVEQLGAS